MVNITRKSITHPHTVEMLWIPFSKACAKLKGTAFEMFTEGSEVREVIQPTMTAEKIWIIHVVHMGTAE